MLRSFNVISKWICGWHYTLQYDLSHKMLLLLSFFLTKHYSLCPLKSEVNKSSNNQPFFTQWSKKFPCFTLRVGKHLYNLSEGRQTPLSPLPSIYLSNTSCCYGVYLRPTAKLVRNFTTWKRISIHSILLGLPSLILLYRTHPAVPSPVPSH